jgi:hypothetical protein
MQERNFRFKRAFALSGTHSSLDSSEWTKPEQVYIALQMVTIVILTFIFFTQDLPYLRPLIAQVEAEQASKVAFDNLSSIPEILKKRNSSS